MRKIVYLNTVLCLTLLSIIALGQQTATTPSADTKADPAAWNALRDTRNTRYYFLSSLSGFTADIVINDNGKIVEGVLNYEVNGGADLQFKGEDDAKSPWAMEMILNIIGHRRRPDFEQADGRHPITFAEDDHSPSGRRIALNDPMKSSYRVRNNRVTEVDRTAGDEHFTISIMEETPAGQGRYLPKHFTVTYFDARTGAVKRTETFTDDYAQVDGLWVPSSRRVLRAENGQVITRIIEFHNPRIRFNNGGASQ